MQIYGVTLNYSKNILFCGLIEPLKRKIKLNNMLHRGTWWRSWLRHCATSRKVAGSIPDVVIGIFY